MEEMIVNVVGAGLAGTEAAYQLAKRGIRVNLYEMKPKKKSPAHSFDGFAELVCSNSFRAAGLTNAVGVLKEEMRRLDSLIMKIAQETRVEAGGALAVDREQFSLEVTKAINENPLITVIPKEIIDIPNDYPTIVATGPLTSDGLSEALKKVTGENYLYFYDAAAPIVSYESIDMSKAYLKSRYDKGEASYINCPMNEQEFENFYNELTNAEVVPLKTFEKEIFFEGCMPFEEMARRGKQTLLFGPMKPVGLTNPYTGERPHAVVQLRMDNAVGSLYNIVGFQTHLKWGEQKRILQMIPGLESCEIVRYGVMHRNTFINSPKLLENTYRFKLDKNVYFAGQLTGVEGYVESTASGMVAGINLARQLAGEELLVFPQTTIIGSMIHYITNASTDGFQPMNANFGIVPDLKVRVKKKERKEAYAKRALEHLDEFIKDKNIT